MDKETQNEQNTQEVDEKNKGIMDWIKEEHKKQLILIGISIPTLIAIVLGLKNKDAMMKLLDNLKEEVEKANLYSSKWFEKATDAEFNAARENVRQDYCASGYDFKSVCSSSSLASMNVISGGASFTTGDKKNICFASLFIYSSSQRYCFLCANVL